MSGKAIHEGLWWPHATEHESSSTTEQQQAWRFLAASGCCALWLTQLSSWGRHATAIFQRGLHILSGSIDSFGYKLGIHMT
jgi:hypothetical protein